MQATVLMLIALGGLGTQNAAPPVMPDPTVVSVVSPPASYGAISAYDLPSPVLPSSGSAVCGCAAEEPRDSFQACLRDTLCSFVIGRSPDVPSAREIEAAYCAR